MPDIDCWGSGRLHGPQGLPVQRTAFAQRSLRVLPLDPPPALRCTHGQADQIEIEEADASVFTGGLGKDSKVRVYNAKNAIFKWKTVETMNAQALEEARQADLRAESAPASKRQKKSKD